MAFGEKGGGILSFRSGKGFPGAWKEGGVWSDVRSRRSSVRKGRNFFCWERGGGGDDSKKEGRATTVTGIIYYYFTRADGRKGGRVPEKKGGKGLRKRKGEIKGDSCWKFRAEHRKGATLT